MLPNYPDADNRTTPSGGRVRRLQCPVHGGKNLSVAVGFSDGRAWAKCWSRDCKSADILAALDLSNPTSTTPAPERVIRTATPTRTPLATLATLPPVSPTAASEYLSGILTPKGATIEYQRNDGKRGKHWRNPDKRRNPGVTGDGWQVRRFNPAAPDSAIAICLAEGEKDAAILALAGLIAFCAPRGAPSLPGADFDELVELAQDTYLPVILAGDRDDVGRKAMRRVKELLRDRGVKPIDTGGLAPEKGSIADLDPLALGALIRLELMPLNSRMVKPIRGAKEHQALWCLRPKHWQGLGGDGQTVKNLRPCGNTAACKECDAWESFLHLERAARCNPAMLVSVSGFGDADSTIPQTVGDAKAYRGAWETRIRRNVAVHPLPPNGLTSERRHFLTALRIRDDYRAGLALILSQPLTVKELERERLRAERAGLTFTVIHNPSRRDIKGVAPKSLTIAMEGVGDTDKTNTWTSSGWPTWIELDKTYQFSDGRDLEEGEPFDPDAIEAREWRKEHRQTWDRAATLRSNVMQREDYAERNAQLWVSACVGLNLETLQAIGNATTTAEIDALLLETDYLGPVALPRDTAGYLNGLKPWRKAYRPVLNVAGVR